MRNPKWHRDEIILALDLYFSKDRGSIDDHNPRIIEVSKLLNEMPLFPNRPDRKRFRNPNGVTLKLANFLAFDDTYKGVGMKGGSKLDQIVFNEFKNDRDRLHSIAASIKEITTNQDINRKIYEIEEDEQTESDVVMEGQLIYKLHKVRERDASIISRKKESIFKQFGKLSCEACVFTFEDFYGQIGKGYIECHHKIPLSKFTTSTPTTLDHLALVCSNCHRMLHRKIDTLSVEDLRQMITYDRI